MKLVYLISLFFLSFVIQAQEAEYKIERNIKTPLLVKFDFSKVENETVWLEPRPTPLPVHHDRFSQAKITRNAERFGKKDPLFKATPYFGNGYISTSEGIKPEVSDTFNGLTVGAAGVPNDNNMAISNGGKIVSVINSSVSMFNEDGSLIKYYTLRSIVAGALPNLDRTYDPKVLYDPYTDRFILVYLQGSTSNDTRIIVGFSKTNDPNSIWNFYAIEGNPFLGKTWSDYPIIAYTKEDLFITVNIIKDNESWQEGFTQSVIWQVSKESGYTGDSLTKNLFHDIKFNGQPVWSICPVQPNFQNKDQGLYLLSVRPSALENDTLFIHRISNSLSSGKTALSLKIAKADKKYGVPPSAYQPAAGFRLQTNDTRVLSGFLHKNHIQYVQTSYIPSSKTSGIFHAIISNPINKPVITANYILHDSIDYAYPSITSTADQSTDFASLITFSHSSAVHYPGTSVVFHNSGLNMPSLYSPVVSIKDGEALINTFVEDSIERWGDYTGIQLKYNEPGIVWLSGSYGKLKGTVQNGTNSVWIGKVNTQKNLLLEQSYQIYPNPAFGLVKVKVTTVDTKPITITCFDLLGQKIMEQKVENLEVGKNIINIAIPSVSSGFYFINIHEYSGRIIFSKKVYLN